MVVDPKPRAHPAKYRPFDWPSGLKLQLEPRDQPLKLDLCALLEQRQTRRTFSNKLENVALGEFLWLACRNRSSRASPFGPNQESRVYPSAGAMHPIHVLLARRGSPWMRYDPIEHALVDLAGSMESAAASRDAAGSLIDLGQGTLIGLVAEFGKTAAKYENHETLVWRDAGVALGYMSIVAEALGLAFCPLGITGQPYLTDYLSDATRLQAAGLAALGPA
ncbi:nitroreductase family protein [Steroidobacter cummioxidans]|uniref:nitroreductase family protein n=1 Tax=Steroidobacter cummioxidans TaxID=1803913 RepID=UPI000E321901|nr:nitroreductase family protein [Steroidobacter cummioxidans]